MDFPRRQGRGGTGILRAVDGVRLHLARGETLGLVGESGSGKSTLARAVLRLYRPTGGSAWLNLSDGLEPDWTDLARLEGSTLRRVRRRIQMVFQDPYASLDPRQTAGAAIAEPLQIFRAGSSREIRRRVEKLMSEVGLDPRFLKRYPHQFSGGQRQRIGIARALALDPRVLICDEPLSALDVSIQAQILNLLLEEKARRGLSYLFIAHDLRVVRQMAQRVAVMVMGRIVEEGPVGDVFSRPAHPYTEALLSAAPVPDPQKESTQRRIILTGDPPSPAARRAGCAFAGRCPKVLPSCREVEPELRPLPGNLLRKVSCHLHHSREE